MLKKKYIGPLSYYNGENEIPAGTFRISASGVSRFFSETSNWWRENLLGEEGFTNSTASVLGTLVHRIAEQYAKNGTVTAQDKEEMEAYIESFTNPEYDTFNPEIDASIIKYQYPIMGMALVNDYLIPNMPDQVEPFVYHEFKKGIGAGGSIDNVTGDCVVDYKTTGALNAPTSISFAYRLQLLTYAYLLRQQGTEISRIRIVYVTRNQVGRVSDKTGKPLKNYPCTVTTLTEQIEEKDFNYIEGILKLISESVEVWNKFPNSRYILAQDYRLKNN